jgi:lactate permease
MGPELTDIMSSLTCIVVMVAVLKLWKPRTILRLEGDKPATLEPHKYTGGQIFMAWLPYLLLVIFVLAWGEPAIKRSLNQFTNGLIPGFIPKNPNGLNGILVPGLHNMITRIPPVTAAPAPYAASFELNWLSAAGTACLFAAIAACVILRVRPKQFVNAYAATFKQLAKPMVTIASMLALAYVLNYSGMTSTLGLAMATTGVMFPFFSAMLGWFGVFLTGSDTSANALFGNLQAVTATTLGMNPILTASVNSAAGVMGKMISPLSIAVAVAATGMTAAVESRIFRFTIKHSVLLMVVMGVISMLFAYVFPGHVPVALPK